MVLNLIFFIWLTDPFWSSLLSSLLTICVYVFLELIKVFFQEKIQIKRFNLKEEEWKNHQPYESNWKKIEMKKDLRNEHFPWSLYHSNYLFPEFEVILLNNTDKTEIIQELKIKIIKQSQISYLPLEISYSWNEINLFDEIDKIDSREDLSFTIYNDTIFWIKKLKFERVTLKDINWNTICFMKNNQEYDIVSWGKQNVNFVFNYDWFIENFYYETKIIPYKQTNQNIKSMISIWKIEFKICYYLNWRKIYSTEYFTINESNNWYNFLFYSNIYGFFMKNPEAWWGWFYASDIWKYLLDISQWNNNTWTIFYYPIKRVIKSKDIDNFIFWLWVNYPCILDLEFIFDFWESSVKKRYKIDYNIIRNESTENFINSSQKMLKK